MKMPISFALPLFSVVLLASCDSSKMTESTPTAATPTASTSPAASAVASPPQGTARISASPNPVPAGDGMGITTVTWSTGDGSMGQVYVTTNGKEEAIFAGAPEGSIAAPWIQSDQNYEFRLYAGTGHSTLLAQTQVTRAK